jgi:hypothetical protein
VGLTTRPTLSASSAIGEHGVGLTTCPTLSASSAIGEHGVGLTTCPTWSGLFFIRTAHIYVFYISICKFMCVAFVGYGG